MILDTAQKIADYTNEPAFDPELVCAVEHNATDYNTTQSHKKQQLSAKGFEMLQQYCAKANPKLAVDCKTFRGRFRLLHAVLDIRVERNPAYTATELLHLSFEKFAEVPKPMNQAQVQRRNTILKNVEFKDTVVNRTLEKRLSKVGGKGVVAKAGPGVQCLLDSVSVGLGFGEDYDSFLWVLSLIVAFLGVGSLVCRFRNVQSGSARLFHTFLGHLGTVLLWMVAQVFSGYTHLLNAHQKLQAAGFTLAATFCWLLYLLCCAPGPNHPWGGARMGAAHTIVTTTTQAATLSRVLLASLGQGVYKDMPHTAVFNVTGFETDVITMHYIPRVKGQNDTDINYKNKTLVTYNWTTFAAFVLPRLDEVHNFTIGSQTFQVAETYQDWIRQVQAEDSDLYQAILTSKRSSTFKTRWFDASVQKLRVVDKQPASPPPVPFWRRAAWMLLGFVG